MRASLLIMAVGAVGTSLNTERTLLIRRHVTAHPCRVNTLHGNDYSPFLYHTHMQTHTSHSHACSLSAFFICINIHMQMYRCLKHINTGAFMHTHTISLTCDHNRCDHRSSLSMIFSVHVYHISP